MSLPDAQLVQMIADLVMQALSRNADSVPVEPATVRPPAGLCTAGGEKTTVQSIQPVTMSMQYDAREIRPAADRPLLGGIITAHQLQDAIRSSPDQVVSLAMSARLTPLAQDIVRANPLAVRRENVGEQEATLGRLTHGLPWCWWTCCACEAIRQTVSERASMLVPLTVPQRPASLAEAVLEADAKIQSGRCAGALLFARRAAKPMCLANRRRALRAIHGHSDDAVIQGIDAVGANVLVLEFPHLNHAQMASRVDLMLRSSPRPPVQLLRPLAEVEGVGR